MLGFNFVDVILIIALLWYVLSHIEEGFFALARRLLAFIGSAILAFLTYGYLANFLVKFIDSPGGILSAGSFLLLFLLLNALLNWGMKAVFSFIPVNIQFSRLSRLMAVIPALIDGLILGSLILFLLVIIPILPQVKSPIEQSRIGNSMVDAAATWEGHLDKIFGKATQETLGFLTVQPTAGESVDLPFKPTTREINMVAEQMMLELVNIEREKVGAPALVWSESLANVGRAHSEDMWVRGYFAHEDPDGKNPFDRLRDAGITFRTAGENLALARTVERAHEGLMNSPGHKRNILDPNFGHAGIGVIDGGIYGLMFTQVFTN